MEQFELFWGGPFSQWEPVEFTADGFTFNCAEQYMMFCKAVLFDDLETAQKIMAIGIGGAAGQKRLGRMVKNFDVDTWEQWAKQIVYAGNIYKFCQNDYLYKNLMATQDRTLVEASPYDKIWGIGLKGDDPRCLSRDTWQGENWLGEVLTRVRNDLKFCSVDSETLDSVSQLIEHNYWRVEDEQE